MVYSPPVLGERDFTTVSGQVLDLDISPPDKRATIKVHVPVRQLPDPTRVCSWPNRHFLVQRSDEASGAILEPNPYDVKHDRIHYSRDYKIVDFHAFVPETDTELTLYPFVASEAPMHFEYVLNNTKMDLAPGPGDTVDVHVQRLDVFDPVITREDGSTYERSGSYRVYVKEGAAWKQMTELKSRYSDCSGAPSVVPFSYPTGTGIDLLPGEYKVVIGFSTENGPEEQVWLCSGVPLSCSRAP
jgi:hypothetical protein